MARQVWGITKLGKKISSDISSRTGTELKILRFLHENGPSSTEDIAMYIGRGTTSTASKLRGMKGKVQELTGAM